jgi:type VI secretion system secreted protein VgrG
MSMDDTPGKEQLRMNAQYDMNSNVNNDQTLDVGKNQTEKVGVDRTREVGNNEKVTVGENKSVKVGTNHDETVGVNQKVDVVNGGEKSWRLAGEKCSALAVGKTRWSVAGGSWRGVCSLIRLCTSPA